MQQFFEIPTRNKQFYMKFLPNSWVLDWPSTHRYIDLVWCVPKTPFKLVRNAFILVQRNKNKLKRTREQAILLLQLVTRNTRFVATMYTRELIIAHQQTCVTSQYLLYNQTTISNNGYNSDGTKHLLGPYKNNGYLGAIQLHLPED